MDVAEAEFLAEKQMIAIVPKFSHGRVELIGGDLGPFTAGSTVQVPLWLGVNLKQRQKCHIQPPDWMSIENLEKKKEDEINSEFFTSPPHAHYMEISQLLMKNAADDVPHADTIRTLIKDIWDLRSAKLRSSIHNFFSRYDGTHAKLNHLTLMEINSVRPLLTKALDHLHTLKKGTETAEDAEASINASTLD